MGDDHNVEAERCLGRDFYSPSSAIKKSIRLAQEFGEPQLLSFYQKQVLLTYFKAKLLSQSERSLF